MQDALQAGDISPAQAESAKQRYAAIHQYFVEAMAKEKQLVVEAKQLNEELQVSFIFRTCSNTAGKALRAHGGKQPLF